MGTSSVWDTLLLPFRDPELNDETGFGALLVAFAALALPVTLRDLAALARRRALTPRGRLALMTAGGLAIAWFATARTPRFNIHLLGLLAAVGASAADGLGRGLGRHPLGVCTLSLAAFTTWFAVGQFGWDIGPPVSRQENRQAPFFAIPEEIDHMPAAVIFNDTLADHTSQPANHWLFGTDHRHMVYDHPGIAVGDDHEFVGRLRRLGVSHVFLRTARHETMTSRYATPLLEPLHILDRGEHRSRLYRVRQ
jgi:hypothetical protein